jgi:lysophospholipase L1-like esterase
MRTTRLFTTAALALGLSALACEDEQLLRPGNTQPVDAMFERYVALGNSITAGFQSLGLNDSVQSAAYPVLLARAMNTHFVAPYMNRPGCPAPLLNVFTLQRLNNTNATFCALRTTQNPPPDFLNNVAFPGAEVLEAINYFDPGIVPAATDVYRTFLLGGLTQVQAARRARPTFVTVWLGNNDVLGALLDPADAGNPALVTAPAAFGTRLNQTLDSLDQIGTIQGGVLLGVVQAVLAPYVSQGRAYFAAAAQIPTLTVLPNCLAFQTVPGGTPPLDTVWVSVPFHYGAPLVAQAAAGTPTTLDCSVPQVISTAEALNMVSSVAQYNAAIQAAATARGWVYIDPNPLLAGLLATPGAIRPFPAFPTTPLDSATTIRAPFGTALSRDGLHPSSSTHRLIAQALQAAINTAYGTSIPAIP